MSGTAIAALGALAPALYLTWRARAVLYQDGARPGFSVVVALTVGAVVWFVVFFLLLWLLAALGVS